jgi:hypothetical protein
MNPAERHPAVRPELGDRARAGPGAERRVKGPGWIRTVKWVVVALLALWVLHLFISWLGSALT